MNYVKLSNGCLINLEAINAISKVFVKYGNKFTFTITVHGSTLEYHYDSEVDADNARDFVISKLDDIGFIHVQK